MRRVATVEGRSLVTVNVHMASTRRSQRDRGSATGCRDDAGQGSSLGTTASTGVSLVCTLVNWVGGSPLGFFPKTPRKKASFPQIFPWASIW